MNSEDMNSIFEQINNLKKPVSKSEKKTVDTSNNTLREILNGVSEEIQRVLEENYAGRFMSDHEYVTIEHQ